jgi:hypothetical protein
LQLQGKTLKMFFLSNAKGLAAGEKRPVLEKKGRPLAHN